MGRKMLSLIVSAFCTAVAVNGLPFGQDAQVVGRDAKLKSSYDFVVVGGGGSGLTVADRLTENPETSVLVIEYGPFDQGEPSAMVPGLLDSDNSPYQFNITSTPQQGLNNRTYPVIAAAVVGGGTVINGLFFNRGSALDYDAWEELGNPGWGWEGLLPYFRKSENFAPAADDFAGEFGISWDTNVHGSTGPVQSSYPVFAYESVKNFFQGWHALGVLTPQDPSSGDANGVYWSTSSLDPNDETRSYARSAHYDRVIDSRPNYHVLANSAVIKINFEGNIAVGVDFIDRETNEVRSVGAAKEVVLAAGTIHSPQVLQLSGIGEKKHLQALGIVTVVDLPGVGQNFQDHPSLYVNYNFKSNIIPNADTLGKNKTYAAEQLELYWEKRQGAYTQAHNSGNTVAFLPLQNITSEYQEIIDRSVALSEPSPSSGHGRDDIDPVDLGYLAQREIILKHYASTETSVGEFAWGTGSTLPIYNIKPLSRGWILIDGTKPLTPPTVDYGTFNDPTDIEIMIAVVRKNREMIASPAMRELTPVELMPGMNVTTDEQIEEVLRAQTSPTGLHLCCTNAMMPREIGGVVDAELRVHGTRGLSVIDASMMPMIPAAHTSATVYAVAERAADIIKARHQI